MGFLQVPLGKLCPGQTPEAHPLHLPYRHLGPDGGVHQELQHRNNVFNGENLGQITTSAHEF